VTAEEDTEPRAPSILKEVRQCIEESRALNTRMANVLEALILDLEFRKEIRIRIGEINARINDLEARQP